MFSRRHPFLFFLLCSASLFTLVILFFIIMMAMAVRNSGYGGFVDGHGERVGVVEVFGVIYESDTILHQIKRFREDDTIKAIVLRINSPGGSVGPSQEIYQEIIKTTDTKPVVASMGAVAASGGYYVAAGADEIYANPGTITGSIGVIMQYTNFKDLLSKIGLTPVVIKSGEYKDIGSPVREMTEAEEKLLQAFSDQIHHQFISAVAEGRKLEKTAVEAIADGRIMSGEAAKAAGLVDKLGNLEDAVAAAGKLAGIEGNTVKVYPIEKRHSIFKYLTGGSPRELMNRMLHSELFAGYLYSPGK